MLEARAVEPHGARTAPAAIGLPELTRGPAQPSGGTTPSCWSTESVFSSTQSSAILPSAKRKKLIPWISIRFPVGGMPNISAVCVPRALHRAATRSPSPVTSSTVEAEIGHPGAEDAEKPLDGLEPADRLGAARVVHDHVRLEHLAGARPVAGVEDLLDEAPGSCRLASHRIGAIITVPREWRAGLRRVCETRIFLT